jgi:hypothetical protein
MNRVIAGIAIAVLALAPAMAAAPYRFGPFKDDLFKLPPPESATADGSFVVIPFSAQRYVNGRDAVPEVKAKPKYVSTAVDKYQKDLTLADGKVTVKFVAVGDIHKPAKSAFIFVHGKGGNRFQGVDDWTFGGNFNRLKNLVTGNGGVYYSPSVRTFDADGVAAIAGLIRYADAQSRGRPVILACASMGSQICWGIARDGESVKRLKGMVIMSGVTDPDFSKTPFYKARLPLWFAHGSRDPVYAAADQRRLFESLYKAKYPTHFTLFQTGNHGTPIRMIDWRRALNWIFAS